MESSISFEMPLNLASNVQGIMLWVVHVASDIYYHSVDYYSAIINNKTSELHGFIVHMSSNRPAKGIHGWPV